MQLTEQYRPRTWEDVVGQDEVLATLNTLRKRGLGGRAYVLTGKSGTGKTTIGRLIASEVAGSLATQEENAKDVTISYIRQMEEEMRTRVLPSDEGGKTGRAYIFNEIHAFSDAVVTRLLTTLENLPAHVAIVFTTTAKAQKSLFAEFEERSRSFSAASALPYLNKPFPSRLQSVCKPFAARKGLAILRWSNASSWSTKKTPVCAALSTVRKTVASWRTARPWPLHNLGEITMKCNPAQPVLFDEISPLEAHAMSISDLPAESADYCESCRGASVTLDGKPAKIIGGPSARFATIEPLDIDVEPIRCCWDIVQDVLDNHEGRFQRADDDTDD